MVEIPDEEFIEMAECPTCGAEINMDATFCPSCGQEFEEDETETTEEFSSDEEGFSSDEEEFTIEAEESFLEEPVGDEEAWADEADIDAPVAAMGSPVESLDPMEDVLADEEKPAKMFWTGVILILLGFFGGPVFSYLKDAMRIDIGPFTAHESFGWVNWTVAIIGSILTAIGVVLLILGWMKIKIWRNRLEELIEEPEEYTEAIE